MIQGFLQEQQMRVIDWPPKGCDMSPIENAWCQVLKEINHVGVNNQDQLWVRVEEGWEQLRRNVGYWGNLVNSMPDRMRAVVEAKGGWTRF
jgi:hypothetical protein